MQISQTSMSMKMQTRVRSEPSRGQARGTRLVFSVEQEWGGAAASDWPSVSGKLVSSFGPSPEVLSRIMDNS